MSTHALIANVMGYVGVIIVLLYYFLMMSRKVDVHGLYFSLMNFIASLLILYSLLYHPNYPSIAIEIAWLAISMYGVVNFIRKRKVAI
jgi:hypothetical protein